MELQAIIHLPKTLRNLKRVREILAVLVRHGFGDLLYRLELVDKVSWFQKRIEQAEEEQKNIHPFERIRRIFEELGPAFIKLGQILATRPDIMPMDLIQELRKLQDDVTPFPIEDLGDIIKEGLGQEKDEIFEELESKALAAASIAQVHLGRLKTGERVVVKLQRPGLNEIIKTDLSILEWFAKQMVERVPELKQYDPVGLVEQFALNITQETNFINEARNMLRFSQNFKHETLLKIPMPFMDFCGRTILTMEFIDGVKIDEVKQLDEWNVDRPVLARVGTKVILESIFEHGFFHADPHPGNVLIPKDGTICLLDYGMMGELDQDRINELLVFMVSILTCDTEMMANLFLELGLIDDQVNIRSLKSEVRAIIMRFTHLELAKLDITEFLTAVFEVIRRHKIKMPADLLMVGKSLATVQGIANELNPQYDPVAELRPYLISTYLKHSLDPKKRAKSVMNLLTDYKLLVKQFPRDMRSILGRLKKGELTVNIDSQDMRELSKVQKSNSRLFSTTLTAITGTLLGTFLVYNPLGPLFYDFSLSQWAGGSIYLFMMPFLTKIFIDVLRK